MRQPRKGVLEDECAAAKTRKRDPSVIAGEMRHFINKRSCYFVTLLCSCSNYTVVWFVALKRRVSNTVVMMLRKLETLLSNRRYCDKATNVHSLKSSRLLILIWKMLLHMAAPTFRELETQREEIWEEAVWTASCLGKTLLSHCTGYRKEQYKLIYSNQSELRQAGILKDKHVFIQKIEIRHCWIDKRVPRRTPVGWVRGSWFHLYLIQKLRGLGELLT